MTGNSQTPNHRPGGVREMFAIAAPMVVSSACDTVMTFTDRWFLARLKPELMNAAMAGGLTSFMMLTFFLGLTGYSTALVAQYLGANRRDRCALAVAQALILSVVAYPIILSFRPLVHHLFDGSNIAPEQLGPQKLYFDIMLSASVLGLFRSSLSGFFSGIGRTRIVMLSSVTAMLVNVGANWVLIYGNLGFPALGIAGAAYGTILGGVCQLGILAAAFLSARNRREFGVRSALRYDGGMMRRLLRFGFPSGAEFFLNLLAFNLLILAFHARGTNVATAVTIVFNWDMVSFVPLIGMNIGVTSLVGRYMGAGKPDIAHRATMSGLRLAWSYGCCTLILFAVFPQYLVGVFRPTHLDGGAFAQSAPLAVYMLRLAAFYVLADATCLVFSGALRGAGDTLWAMCISVGLHWVLVAVLMTLLRVLHAPVETAWAVLVAVILCFSGIFYLRYRSGKWRTIRVVHEPESAQSAALADGLHETTDI